MVGAIMNAATQQEVERVVDDVRQEQPGLQRKLDEYRQRRSAYEAVRTQRDDPHSKSRSVQPRYSV
jgi:hypothetical protein